MHITYTTETSSSPILTVSIFNSLDLISDSEELLATNFVEYYVSNGTPVLPVSCTGIDGIRMDPRKMSAVGTNSNFSR